MTRDRLESIAAGPRNDSALTDAVFAYSSQISWMNSTGSKTEGAGAVPDAAIALLKSRISNAETAYWQGAHPGVREADIVIAINELADTLHLVEHARTTPTQVHDLRVSTLVTFPRLMGRHLGAKDASGHFHLSETMSPLQAVHLTLNLIDMKFTLPEYQVTPAEWEAAYAAPKKPEAAGFRIYSPWQNPRTLELHESVGKGLEGLTEIDAVELALRTLKHLGVE